MAILLFLVSQEDGGFFSWIIGRGCHPLTIDIDLPRVFTFFHCHPQSLWSSKNNWSCILCIDIDLPQVFISPSPFMIVILIILILRFLQLIFIFVLVFNILFIKKQPPFHLRFCSPVKKYNWTKKPPSPSLPVHVQHSQDLRDFHDENDEGYFHLIAIFLMILNIHWPESLLLWLSASQNGSKYMYLKKANSPDGRRGEHLTFDCFFRRQKKMLGML